MVLVQLVVCMQKNANLPILISLYKAQVQVDQGVPHKTRYTETNRKKLGKTLEHMGTGGKVPEQNTNGLCSTIKN